ncbi:MAG: DUF1841 family protein [Chromatiales bacterium]
MSAQRRDASSPRPKQLGGLALGPLEFMLAGVVAEHSEYHALLTAADFPLEEEYTPERGIANPFLHMGMHLAKNR